ncbi:MAG: GGDEF domain-containing protein [Christensenellaceae bacterium]|jgi:diguanylate cyclase (GGDEF)-like protein|nr:GGDEF domain-containing protein [Christensenellaceae bacterium]
MEVTPKLKKRIVIGFVCMSLFILALVVGMSVYNGINSLGILEDSIESQIISISLAASDIVKEHSTDIGAYDEIIRNLPAGYDDDNGGWPDEVASAYYEEDYSKTLVRLRDLQKSTGAEYIYVLRKVGDKYYFIYDTDEEDEKPFTSYELDTVHKEAFSGKTVAGVMNSEDEYGSFNTGAVPIKTPGNGVVGIVATDLRDVLFVKTRKAFIINEVLLSVLLALTLLGVGCALWFLLSKVQKIQGELNRIAYYDKLTELPNRRFLLDYLGKLTQKRDVAAPFALFFVDMDNFKRVNDSAGHDAGDALLVLFAKYLQTCVSPHDDPKKTVFRIESGSLNVTARVGGDEFILVVSGITTEEEATTFADRILSGLNNKDLSTYVKNYRLGLSIGVALYPVHTSDFHVLITYADLAMYNAKHAGKNRFRIYDPVLSSNADAEDEE